MDARSASDVALANIAYTDVAKLEQLKHGGEGSLKQAAKQFESVFVGMWLKTMRDAGAVFSEGNYMSSHAVDTHQEMLDSQWAIHVSESGGLGLAEVIERQLSGEAAPIRRDPAVQRIDIEPASGAQQAAFDGRAGFVRTLTEVATKVLQGSGLPVAGVVAQAALETGWGQHVPHHASGQSSNNLFGIKADGWSGEQVALPTREHVLGQWLERLDNFRAYPDLESGLKDLRALLTENPRYQAVVEQVKARAGDTAQEVAAFADALQEAGYATDPRYAEKLKAVAQTLSERFGVP